MGLGMVVHSMQVIQVTVRGYGIHAHKRVHVFRNNDLRVAKTLAENLNSLFVVGR